MQADRRRWLFWAAAAGCLSGCASTSLPLHSLPTSPIVDLTAGHLGSTALLIVARDEGFAGSALAVSVSIDGRNLSTLGPGAAIRARVPAGQITLLLEESFAVREVQARPELPPHSQPLTPAPIVGGIQRRPRSLDIIAASGATVLIRLGYDDRGTLNVWRAHD